MRPTIDRLIEAGHSSQVNDAGRFVATKADSLIDGVRTTNVRWVPESNPARELFLLVDGLDDISELNAIAEYVAEQFADDYATA